MMQVASMPFGLVSTQAPLISHSTRSVKLLFFLKASAVVVIEEWRAGGGRGGGDCVEHEVER